MITIKGVVEQGRRLGRELGFPTANIAIDPTLGVENGVYESWISIEGHPKPLRSISNIGSNPTIGKTARRMETHIIGESLNLYGEVVTITLGRKLRSEMKFNSLEELKAQIKKDLKSLL
ncbi:MAG: riboflavin kinase [Rikenellaceae bacterium]